MFFFPVGHKNKKTRRVPWVTLGIFALCSLVFVWTLAEAGRLQPQLETTLHESMQLLQEDPRLEMSDDLGRIVSPAIPLLEMDPESLPGEVDPELQEEMDAVDEEFRALMAQDVRHKMSYGGHNPEIWKSLLSLFSHGGWEHFLMNLWFLWVCGVALEDRLGRWLFLGLYLGTGIAAALVHSALSDLPLIGASGAIAGCMGLFAVMMPTDKLGMLFAGVVPGRFPASTEKGITIPFVLMTFMIRYFEARAVLLIVIWGAMEFLSQYLYADSDGIAHGAHLGGLVTGVVAGAALRMSGKAKKIQESVAQLTYSRHDLGTAQEMIRDAHYMEAARFLDGLKRRENADHLAIEEKQLALLAATQDKQVDAQVRSSLLREYMKRGVNPMELYRGAVRESTDSLIPASLRLALAERVAKGSSADALEILSRMDHLRLDEFSRLRVHLLAARLRLEVGHSEAAREELNLAQPLLLLAPDLQQEWESLLQQTDQNGGFVLERVE